MLPLTPALRLLSAASVVARASGPLDGMTVHGGYSRYFRVNKGGASTADVEFEYTASRACGLGCGGQRSWKFSGAVSIGGPQPTMTEYEER